MKLLFIFAFLFNVAVGFAQTINDSINKEEIKSIVDYLASDELKGRANFTEEQALASSFINDYFKKIGLEPFSLLDSYYHHFMVYGINHKGDSGELRNVVAMIPGRKYPYEAVIFSAHYDHLKANEIHNGANDNASGTAAVLVLAKYFSLRKDNERTLIFCLFAGEELGLLGSRAFAKYVKPEAIKAVINIEMIGQTGKTGKNAFMVTGSDHSNLKKILGKNLAGNTVVIKKEGLDRQLLFTRSDNFPFAQLGIPAHSIMCSDDEDSCYHKPCDDSERIDIDNMRVIIQAISKATQSIIKGEDTPRRIRLN